MVAAARECDVLCVVSCGTAVTIDVVDGMTHLGGYIVPGLALMESSLQAGTRKVRYDSLAEPATALGRDTGSAVRNGVLACLVALVERVVREHGVSRLILTGGDADRVADELGIPCEVDPGLLLKGMLRYFENTSDPHGMGASPDPGE
jgi:type III pantothenate kinase